MNNSYKFKAGRYYGFTFLITCLFWLAGAAVSQQSRGGLYMVLMLPGLLTPFAVSLIMTFASGDAGLKKDFLNRLVNLKRIRLKILPVFLLIMPVSVLISISLSVAFGGSPDQFLPAEGFSFSTGVVPVLAVLLLAAAFEELGWRGYAYDSLLQKFSVFKATLIFSFLWSLWHLPLLLVRGSYQFEILEQNVFYALNFFVGILPMGFIISWICLKNRKSVASAVLFHFIINMSQEALSMTQDTKCIQTGVLMLFALLIVIYDRSLFFSRSGEGSDRQSGGMTE